MSYTVIDICGDERLEGVTIAKVDENRKPIPGTEEYIECDTLLLSVGLIPENELSKTADIELSNITNGAVVDQDRQCSVEGIFACGNVLHVHDLVDYVSDEAEIAGRNAAEYIKGSKTETVSIPITTDGRVRYTVPQVITKKKDVTVYFRVSDVFKNVCLNIYSGKKVIMSKKIRKAAPGEMETVLIKKELIEDVSELVFKLEEQ